MSKFDPLRDRTFLWSLICLAFPAGGLVFAKEHGMELEDVLEIPMMSTLYWCFVALFVLWAVQFVIWAIRTIPKSAYLAWEKHKQWKEERKLYTKEEVWSVEHPRFVGWMWMICFVVAGAVWGFMVDESHMRIIFMVGVFGMVLLHKLSKLRYAKLKSGDSVEVPTE